MAAPAVSSNVPQESYRPRVDSSAPASSTARNGTCLCEMLRGTCVRTPWVGGSHETVRAMSAPDETCSSVIACAWVGSARDDTRVG